MSNWQCFGCGLESADSIPPGICPRCSRVECFERPNQYKAPRSVAQIPDVSLPRIPTGEVDVDSILWGGFVEGSRVMIWGRGGTGKSRLAMRWATGSRSALYISLEMYEPIAAQSARSAGATPERIFITESYDNFPRKALECNAKIVVLDSISVVPREDQKELLARLKRWAEKHSAVVIVICHQNKHGQHAGSHAIQHWGDTEIFLKASKTGATLVEVMKSRGSPLGKCRTSLGKLLENNNSDESPEQESNQIVSTRGRLKIL